MCGIRCRLESYQRNEDHTSEEWSSLSSQTIIPEWLSRRGPDGQSSLSFDVTVSLGSSPAPQKNVRCLLQASVLCLRPSHVSQPLKIIIKGGEDHETLDGSIRTDNDLDASPPSLIAYLCWNGEIYQVLRGENDLDDDSEKGLDLLLHSDTKWMAYEIERILIEAESSHNRMVLLEGLGNLMSRLNAEFAFCLVVVVVVHMDSGGDLSGIYFGRDCFGRRSLVVNHDPVTSIVPQREQPTTPAATCLWELASVVTNQNEVGCWTEVPPCTISHTDWNTGHTFHHSWQTLTLPRPKSLLTPSGDDLSKFYQTVLYQLLRDAVQRRLQWKKTEYHAKCSILFSGGLDSVVLAYLALELCPPATVELVNVSFALDSNDEKTTVAADTQAAQESLADLQRLFPNHNLSLVHRTVTWMEIQKVQESHIPNLLYPKDVAVVMDMNIATALWFAAETASARILISGLGADEYLGGYGRHRQAFQESGEMGLRKELALDQGRLWDRNGGRDDRILSDLGKEVRYPYLDSQVTHFLQTICPLSYICNFSPPRRNNDDDDNELGDKHLLRQLAQSLGLIAASTAVKRAIQFGSRISHVVDKQRFGSRRKANKQKKTQ